MDSQPASFCVRCGGPLAQRVIEAERRLRAVCERCGFIAFCNPRVLVSTLVAVAYEVLLCRRAVAPAAGCWALPGGFLECGESLEQAAARETFEETGVRLDPRQLHLHAVSSLPDINEVYIGFVGQLSSRPTLSCGAECSDVRFFSEESVPWSELAYPDIKNYLRVLFCESRRGERTIHFSCLDAVAVTSCAYRVCSTLTTTRLRAAQIQAAR